MPRPKTKAEYVRNLKRIYDNFSVKDLTFDEFRNQMLELEDPKAIARMRAEKHEQRSNIAVPRKRIIT